MSSATNSERPIPGVEGQYHHRIKRTTSTTKRGLTDRRNERRLMLLRRQHENRKHQLRRQEHLNKQSLHHARIPAQRRLHVQSSGEHALH